MKDQYENRNVYIGNGESKKRTAIALEPQFWQAIERLAQDEGMTWNLWAERRLQDQPDDISSRAAWLRLAVLDTLMRSH